ncbi:MAG: TIGR01459 family HAD-type hydrolase [Legionellales bacterium]|nr:TIGR01459 family HAD-type hydrolase [Legionellales bacterium]OUX64715.1 MAG: hypothetical protein CBE41_02690 [Gammaproteobacteria bacterium TMED281]
MKKINSILDVVDQYDLILCDIWGVIYNGHQLFPNVKDCLKSIKTPLCFLTNSSLNASSLVDLLNTLELKKGEHFEKLVSSGEFFRQSIITQRLPLQYPSTYLFIGSNSHVVNDLPNFNRVDDVDTADCIVLAGNNPSSNFKTDLKEIFTKAAERKLTLFCLNPDMIAINNTNEAILCDGQVAHNYKQNGGNVYSMGKPDKPIFDYAINQFQLDSPKILMIGDTIGTDGMGAKNSNIDFALVSSGVEHHIWQSEKSQLSFEEWLIHANQPVTWLLDSLS